MDSIKHRISNIFDSKELLLNNERGIALYEFLLKEGYLFEISPNYTNYGDWLEVTITDILDLPDRYNQCKKTTHYVYLISKKESPFFGEKGVAPNYYFRTKNNNYSPF